MTDYNKNFDELVEKQKKEIEKKLKELKESAGKLNTEPTYSPTVAKVNTQSAHSPTIAKVNIEPTSTHQEIIKTNEYSPTIYVKFLIVIAKINLALTGVFLVMAIVTSWSTNQTSMIAAIVSLSGSVGGLVTAHIITTIEKCAFYMERINSKLN